ncbi:MAG: DUF4097 domain-containing protein [Acidimicrobiia bacterium]
MSTRKERLEAGPGVRVEAVTYSGDIVVERGPTGFVDVEVRGGNPETYRIEQHGHVVSITPESRRGRTRRFSSSNLVLTVPEDAELRLKTGSGDLFAHAPLASVEGSVASGDIHIGTVLGDAHLKSASGDVYLDECRGDIRVNSASGDVRLGIMEGRVVTHSASGDVYVDRACSTVTTRTASGDVTVHELAGDGLEGKTLSGNVRVGIPPRRIVDVDLQSLSGELKNNLPRSAGSSGGTRRTLSIRLKTVSGNLYLDGA